MKALRDILLDVFGDKSELTKSIATATVVKDNYHTVKAIETSYAGYNFRSRTEARWGVFLDAFGLKWNYESEGYHLGNGSMYLPDFTIRSPAGTGFVLEIKHQNLGSVDRSIATDKVRILVLNNITDIGVIAFGQPDLAACLTVMYKGDDKAILSRETTVGQFFAGELLGAAIHKSKSARFEHGESGAG